MRICEHFMIRRFDIVHISCHSLYILFSFNIVLYSLSSVSSLCTNYISRTLQFVREVQHTINLLPFAKHTHEILQTGHALSFSLFSAVFFPDCRTCPCTTFSFLFASSFQFYFLRCLKGSARCFQCFLNKFLELVFALNWWLLVF